MLYYDRIDLSGGIDPIKSNSGKECMVYHYWFFNRGFEDLKIYDHMLDKVLNKIKE